MPKYFPGEDILVDLDSPPDSVLTLSESVSLSTSLSKTGKSDNKLFKYTIDNIQVNFSASQSRSSDITYSNKRSETYSGKFSYNFPFGRNNYINPLGWMKGWPLVGASFSDLQIYYTPSAFRTSLNLNEKLSWNQTRSGIRSPDNYNFGLDRSLNLDYKVTNNLSTISKFPVTIQSAPIDRPRSSSQLF